MTVDRGFAEGSEVGIDKLLPPNQTNNPYLGSVSLVGAQRRPLPSHVIEQIDDPWTCPEHLLPWCAHHYSVRIWKNEWPTAKKRAVIANWIKLSRKFGTKAGLAGALEVTDARLVKAVTPPARLFFSRSWTDEERAAFLARYPQLRIYPYRTRGKSVGFHAGRCWTNGKTFLVKGDTELRATPRSFIWDQGQETELTTIERRWNTDTTSVEEFVQVRKRAKKHGVFFPAKPAFKFVKSNAAERIYTVRTRRTLEVPGEERLALKTLRPGLEPINVLSEIVHERGKATIFAPGRSKFGTRGGFCFRESNARERVFHRVYLFDPTRPLYARNAKTFAGTMRFGVPAHHAIVKVEIRDKRPKRAFGRFMSGYFHKSDHQGLSDALHAIRVSKRHSDKILVTTVTRKRVTVSAGLKCGFTCGQIVENT